MLEELLFAVLCRWLFAPYTDPTIPALAGPSDSSRFVVVLRSEEEESRRDERLRGVAGEGTSREASL